MKTNLHIKILFIFLIFLVIANILFWTIAWSWQDGNLYIYFFDIGQGDAIYIRTPQRQDILIDGGPDNKILAKLGEVMPFYDKKIELMVLTHPHADHINGLIDVLNRYEVDQILYTGINYDNAAYKEWQSLIKEKDISTNIALAGQKINLGEAEMDIIYPNINFQVKNIDNLNNSSIVSRLVFGNTSFLFTGDAEKEVEVLLLKNYPDNNLKSDVIKAGHHGSKTASSRNFIEAVGPQMAVISAGKNNKFGHPHESTLKIFENFGIRIFRTDLKGNIKCFSNKVDYYCEGES